MRLTHRTRCLNRCRRQIEADLQSAIAAEFRWLWRQLYPKLRALRLKREGKISKRQLQKQIDLSSLWPAFEQRLIEAVGTVVEAASATLANTENEFWQRRGRDLDIRPDDIARRYETNLATEVKEISDTTRRDIAADVVEWYNTPGQTLQSLTSRVKQKVGPSRATTIAMTETTRLNSAATNETMARLGVGEWWWQTMRDEIVCRKPLVGPDGLTYNGCRGLHGQRFSINQPMPPDSSHPNCRCNPQPIVPGGAYEGG